MGKGLEQTFPQERHINDIISHHGNAKQSHNEIRSHIHQGGWTKSQIITKADKDVGKLKPSCNSGEPCKNKKYSLFGKQSGISSND